MLHFVAPWIAISYKRARQCSPESFRDSTLYPWKAPPPRLPPPSTGRLQIAGQGRNDRRFGWHSLLNLGGSRIGWLVGLRDQAADQGRQDGRANRFHSPTEHEFGGGTTNASLTGAHTATGLEFGVAPATELADTTDGDVFTATKKCFVGRERFEFGAESKSCSEGSPETMP
jgi:hypothetical protein